jgi:hypothetical protein
MSMTNDEVVAAVVETRILVRSLHERLLGDGKTGEIPQMKADIGDLKTARDTAKGSVGTLKWIIGLVGLAEIGHWFISWGKH